MIQQLCFGASQIVSFTCVLTCGIIAHKTAEIYSCCVQRKYYRGIILRYVSVVK